MKAITAVTDKALELIQPRMTILLGGGSNVKQLAIRLATLPDLDLTICTPSELTRRSCLQLGLNISELDQIKRIDIGFDGCDSVDLQFRALKSNGGIHTLEKIYAQAATRYIILTKTERLSSQLDPNIPLTLEVIPAAVPTLCLQIKKLDCSVTPRMGTAVASLARTPNGNCLLDCYEKEWSDITTLNDKISSLNGVVGTSLFEDYITDVYALNPDNTIKEIKKGEVL
ncbi:ribose-5-phosphate isomerase A [Liquorilactobacillus oeni]|uniref:ribose-5-phosphate isomerase n=1 Tax=Liquorilactobacillus oeni DSM 19972 TaxID=1423777 RepID=A0A0R1M9T5_9LACO|nr:ribose-5-phosphate isomerase A [Liquorilactobacillus oeni]KRL05101.1 ribose 5-phosphate isomerase [Liquorilactobacillus oeni DSM 19972]